MITESQYAEAVAALKAPMTETYLALFGRISGLSRDAVLARLEASRGQARNVIANYEAERAIARGEAPQPGLELPFRIHLQLIHIVMTRIFEARSPERYLGRLVKHYGDPLSGKYDVLASSPYMLSCTWLETSTSRDAEQAFDQIARSDEWIATQGRGGSKVVAIGAVRSA